ncbi:MAG: hypothetical protein ACI9R3_001634 [Verrucomicrobiales bacterium]
MLAQKYKVIEATALRLILPGANVTLAISSNAKRTT